MVEKLTKYNVGMCHCFLGEHMETVESSDGEFFKVEDVEPILNSLQQLKAEIAAFANELDSLYIKDCDLANAKDLVERMRQLSAI